MTGHALSYRRYSSGSQAQGSSIDRQDRMISDWLLKHPDVEYHPDISPSDLGVSGWSGAALEQGLGSLLEAAKAGTLGEGWYLLIEDYSRLGRLEPFAMLDVLRHLIDTGMTVVTLANGVEYSRQSTRENPGLLFILIGEISAANSYSETLSRRIGASYDKRRRDAAEGKRPKRRTPWWMDKQGELVEPQATAARRLFTGYLEGLGERRLLRQLENELGDDCPLSEPTSVKRSLINRMALGEWEGHTVYPALVDTETFYRVQQLMGSRGNQNAAAARTWALAGICRCGTCGANGQIKRTKGKAPLVYCGVRSRKGPEHCQNGKGMPDMVLRFIVAEAESYYREAAQATGDDAAKLVDAQESIRELEGKIETCIDTLMSVQSDALRARLKGLEATLAETKAEYARMLQTAPAPMLGDVDELAAGTYDELRHNRTLQQLGVQLTWYPDGSITCGDLTYSYSGWRAATGYTLLDSSGKVVDLQQHSDAAYEI